MKTIIFACVHNAGRSQMAGAIFNRLCDASKVRGISAGTQPAEQVHPVVAEVMLEEGVDLRLRKPQKLTQELAAQATLLVTMGCEENCPYVPGLERLDWPLRDPKGLSFDEVRAIRLDIQRRVELLLNERGWR